MRMSRGSADSTHSTGGVPSLPAPGLTSSSHVEVRRSARRRRTVSGFREGDRTVVVVPTGLPAAEEADLVARMVARVVAGERRRGPDLDLESRARALSSRYLGGAACPSSVRWVTNQTTRWGSCTPGTGAIRLSHGLQGMPSWVVDYVLLHELAHLLVPHHGPDFWAILAAYPHTERARGFLHGVTHAARSPAAPGIGGGPEPDECDEGALVLGGGFRDGERSSSR